MKKTGGRERATRNALALALANECEECGGACKEKYRVMSLFNSTTARTTTIVASLF